MPKSTRISISLPTKFLHHFDKVLKETGYNSRSNCIHKAMINYIEQYDSKNEIKGEHIGTISIIYNHRSRVLEHITYIQNKFHIYIKSMQHIHLTKELSIEVIIVRGEMKYITMLANKILRLNCVEEVKLTSSFLEKK